jgi:APA family basic amino acid/polyamine antiporter
VKEKLTKKFGIMSTASLIVGIVIGVGVYFRTGSLMTITQGNTIIGLYAWIFGALITILAGLCFAELASNYTTTGGDITYMQYTAGDAPACMFGWGNVLVNKPALTAIFAWAGGNWISNVFSLNSKVFQLPFAIIFVTISFGINLFKPKSGAKNQIILTVIKIIPLVLLIVFGLFAGHGEISQLANPVKLKSGSNALFVFFATLIPVVFTYDGYVVAATVSTEMENPKKNLPKALIGGLSFVAVVYILLYLGFINVFPAAKLVTNVPFGIAKELFGGFGSRVLMVGITISALGALNGMTIAAIRMPYSLAIRNMIIFSDKFKKINEKTNTPVNSGILMYCLTIFYVLCNFLLGAAGDFSGIAAVTTYIWYTMIYAGMIRLRSQGKLRSDGFKTPLFPLIPVIVIITSLTLVVGLFFVNADTTRNTIISIIVYLSGLLIYSANKNKIIKTEPDAENDND